MSWDEEEAKAQGEYLARLKHDTCQGQPLPEAYLEGAENGWNAATAWFKAAAVRQILGGGSSEA